MSFLSALAAGGGIVSDALGMGMSQHNFNEQMRMSQAQLDWERAKFGTEVDMANSAHQREVADLRKAGLNPILSVTGGRGAPVASGGGGGGSIPSAPHYSTGSASGALSSAAQLRLEEKRISNETLLAEASAAERKALAQVALSQIPEAASRTAERTAHIGVMESQIPINRTMVDEMLNKIRLMQSEANEKNWSAKYLESRIPQQEFLSELAKFLLDLTKGGNRTEGGGAVNRLLDKVENFSLPRLPTTKDLWDWAAKRGGDAMKWMHEFFGTGVAPGAPENGVTHGGAHSARQLDRW